MKKFYTILTILLLTSTVFAQSPEKMSYQAIVRDASNALVISQPIGMKISILQGSSTGSAVYVETQSPSTNTNGLVTVEIGDGSMVSGDFSTINWANGPYFIKTETDPTGGSNYSISGTSQLMSVPYSLHSNTTDSLTNGETDPVFENSIAEGITATDTALWNQQTVDTDTHIDSIGIANLGFLADEVDGSITNEIQDISLTGSSLSITSGSTIDLSTLDNGGWSTTGDSGTSATTNFIGTTDSVSLNFRTNDTLRVRVTTKGQIEVLNTGGSVYIGEGAGENSLLFRQNTFVGVNSGNSTVSGYNNSAYGAYSFYYNITGYNNSAFGAYALHDNDSGIANTAIGDASLASNTSGSSNTAVGAKTLLNNTTGSENTAIGYSALKTGNSTRNTAVGSLALSKNVTGSYNSAFGASSLEDNTTGKFNIAIGYYALNSNTTGKWNTSNGSFSLNGNTTGNGNTANGYSVLSSNSNGNYNTATGYLSMYSNSTGAHNTADGAYSLFKNSSGVSNTANGYYALYKNLNGNGNTANGSFALRNNTTADYNTATGFSSLNNNTTGSQNSSNGAFSLYNNSTGSDNTANGYYALYANSTGAHNTATGVSALSNNTVGSLNTANGKYALYHSISGLVNTANGVYALFNNTTGNYNTANGGYSLYYNTTGQANTASGFRALNNNTDGYYNVASGYQTLYYNIGGDYNTASGTWALYNNTTGSNNIAIGFDALYANTTGSQNTGIGTYAGSAGNYSNRTAIGYSSQNTASNQIRLGNAPVTSIGGSANWTNISDKRFKTNIQENITGLDFILKLRPVSYNLDMDAIAQFTQTPDSLRLPESEALKASEIQTGFIAQEVEEAAQSVGFDFHGIDAPKNENDYYGLRYAEFVVPLVKGIQEQQEMIQSLEKENEELKNTLELLLQRVEKLESK